MQTALLSTISMMAGFIGSLMSGGSIVIFSVLTSLDIPVQSAVGTLKVAIAALTLVSAATYYRGGAVEIRTVPYLVSFSIIGALGGSYLFSSLPAGPAGAVSLGLLLIGLYFSVRPFWLAVICVKFVNIVTANLPASTHRLAFGGNGYTPHLQAPQTNIPTPNHITVSLKTTLRTLQNPVPIRA